MRLSNLYQSMSNDERDVLAQRAGTSPQYLRQLATRWRGRRPRLPLFTRLAKADPRLTMEDMLAEFNEPAPAQPEPNGA